MANFTPSLKGGANANRDWEATFTSWGAAPGPTEMTKCDNAERAVRNAINSSAKLSTKDIKVFTQGSYANRTNVRQDSDVDICVMYRNAWSTDYSMSEGVSDLVLGYVPARYTHAEFKEDVEMALVGYFGKDFVTRGSKAFDVHANTYRIHADVVPAFEHRRFHGTAQSPWYHSGTKIWPDYGTAIVNWPQQNCDRGVNKNHETGNRFKAVTRILKRLRNEMADEGYASAAPIPSYLIECLAWNVPNEGYNHDTLGADVRYAIAFAWNNTRAGEASNRWTEVNQLKYLFWTGQPWTRAQANTFLDAAWHYIGFE